MKKTKTSVRKLTEKEPLILPLPFKENGETILIKFKGYYPKSMIIYRA